MTELDRPSTCQQCGKPLPAARNTGRTRKYCSARCRSAARRERSAEAARELENVAHVHDDLTADSRKVMLDLIADETGSGVAGAAAADGREAARGLLGQLFAAESASPLDVIAFIQGAASEITEGTQAAVERARTAGHTWAEVGQVLGISRQAAFQRFGRPVDPRTGQPMAAALLPGAAERGAALLTDLSRAAGPRSAGTSTSGSRRNSMPTASPCCGPGSPGCSAGWSGWASRWPFRPVTGPWWTSRSPSKPPSEPPGSATTPTGKSPG